MPMLCRAVALALLCSIPASAVAAECTSTDRAFGGINDAPEVRAFECRNLSGGGALRVTFLRLSEGVAGNLAMRERIPELDRFFNTQFVTENDVSKAMEVLFRNYGHKNVFRADAIRFALNIKSVPSVGAKRTRWKSIDLTSVATPNQKYRRVWSVTKPFGFVAEPELLIPDVEKALGRSGPWPAGWKHFYSGCEDDFIACTQLWKYLTIEEINRAEQDMTRAYNKRKQRSQGQFHVEAEGARDDIHPDDRAEASNWPKAALHYKARFALLRHLAKQGWHEKFLVATFGAECGAETALGYSGRPLSLDVAIIENITNDQITIESVLGVQVKAPGLRPIVSTDVFQAHMAPLPMKSIAVPAQGSERQILAVLPTSLDAALPFHTVRS